MENKAPRFHAVARRMAEIARDPDLIAEAVRTSIRVVAVAARKEALEPLADAAADVARHVAHSAHIVASRARATLAQLPQRVERAAEPVAALARRAHTATLQAGYRAGPTLPETVTKSAALLEQQAFRAELQSQAPAPRPSESLTRAPEAQLQPTPQSVQYARSHPVQPGQPPQRQQVRHHHHR
jgi:hypothetical protein